MQVGSNMIAKTAQIYPNVRLGKGICIESFCVIGAASKNSNGKVTAIGNNALIRSHTVIYAGNRIGNNFQAGNGVNIREFNVIGNNVSIGTHSIIEHHVIMESGVRIHSNVFVPEFTVLKKNSWLGPNVVITNAKYPKHPQAKKKLKGATVEENAKIGANSTLLPGVIIGKNSLVGAGSLVTKNIEPDSIYAGFPAKFLRKIDY